MKHFNENVCRSMSALFATLILTLVFSPAAFAQTTVFTYQGKLTDGTNAAPSGQYDMRFRLYDSPTPGTGTQSGGDVVFSAVTSNAVTVSNGVFTVRLDFTSSPFAAGAARYLEISVKKAADADYAILTPREQITSSPYSIRTLSAAAADSLSSACSGCVTSNQIASVDGGKIAGNITTATIGGANVTGTVASATTANTATTAGNVTGVVAIANGGTGSSTKNFVDLTTAQTVAGAKTFSDNLRNTGLFRSGSETGTTDAPDVNNTSGYKGLVVRRTNSFSQNAGNFVARTDYLRLERDGTPGGWRIANDALASSNERQAIHCFAITGGSTILAVRLIIPGGTAAGTNQLFTNAQNVEYMQCSFGNAFGARQLTQVTLQRDAGDFYWVGTVTSTFNQ